jgi:hypothetical protein
MEVGYLLVAPNGTEFTGTADAGEMRAPEDSEFVRGFVKLAPGLHVAVSALVSAEYSGSVL